MNALEKVNHVFTKYLIWIVIAVAAVTLAEPASFLWAAPHITLLLQIIMFTMGLTMKPSDFGEVVKRPWQVLLVSALQFLWMPFAGYMLAQIFNLPAELALGLILVGSVPGGTSSNVLTYLANGDLPLSIAATSVSTLLAPFLTPISLMIYGGQYLEMSFSAMFMSIVKVVLIPILGGFILNYLFKDKVKKVTTTLPTLSSVTVLIALGGTVAVSRDNLLETGLLIFFLVFLQNTSGYAITTLICRLLRVSKISTRAMSIEVGTQTTALAASLALQHFTPASALAGAAGAIVHTVVGSVYASLCRKKDEREAKMATQAAEVASSSV